jgi:hypothetical protein
LPSLKFHTHVKESTYLGVRQAAELGNMNSLPNIPKLCSCITLYIIIAPAIYNLLIKCVHYKTTAVGHLSLINLFCLVEKIRSSIQVRSVRTRSPLLRIVDASVVTVLLSTILFILFSVYSPWKHKLMHYNRLLALETQV